MSLETENKVQEIGKKSQEVRARLINRTSKSGEMSRRGHPSLAMEVVQTVDMPHQLYICLLYTSPSPRDATLSRMPSSA